MLMLELRLTFGNANEDESGRALNLNMLTFVNFLRERLLPE